MFHFNIDVAWIFCRFLFAPSIRNVFFSLESPCFLFLLWGLFFPPSFCHAFFLSRPPFNLTKRWHGHHVGANGQLTFSSSEVFYGCIIQSSRRCRGDPLKVQSVQPKLTHFLQILDKAQNFEKFRTIAINSKFCYTLGFGKKLYFRKDQSPKFREASDFSHKFQILWYSGFW